MTPEEAYREAMQTGYSEELEDIACKSHSYAYYFALRVHGSDIEKCQKAACKEPSSAYSFALDVSEADILYCSKFIINNKTWAKVFIINRPQHMELLQNEPGWKDIITQEMIDKYKIESILL